MWLKKIVQKYGIDVPLYIVTGWDNASVPENEVIPFWGAYPEAPWNADIGKITRNAPTTSNRLISCARIICRKRIGAIIVEYVCFCVC